MKFDEIEKKTTNHDNDKYVSRQEFNTLTTENFAARLKQANLGNKNDIAVFVKRQILLKN